MVEEARLESVYTPKRYHEFESRSLRNKCCKSVNRIKNTQFTPKNVKLGVFYTI